MFLCACARALQADPCDGGPPNASGTGGSVGNGGGSGSSGGGRSRKPTAAIAAADRGSKTDAGPGQAGHLDDNAQGSRKRPSEPRLQSLLTDDAVKTVLEHGKYSFLGKLLDALLYTNRKELLRARGITEKIDRLHAKFCQSEVGDGAGSAGAAPPAGGSSIAAPGTGVATGGAGPASSMGLDRSYGVTGTADHLAGPSVSGSLDSDVSMAVAPEKVTLLLYPRDNDVVDFFEEKPWAQWKVSVPLSLTVSAFIAQMRKRFEKKARRRDPNSSDHILSGFRYSWRCGSRWGWTFWFNDH